ncbi:MAG: transcriptional repressor LexA [Candidatus Sungbacteria bacterium]|nr:transcriptional repressor LexA [bacterium]MDZ4260134.1 transcriptional repressor LexA [Candidatus Sungbacteria bacterium]
MTYIIYKQKIISFYKKHKRMPGYQEIMGLTGFKSKNAVFKLIQRMVEEGAVEKDVKGRLLPARLTNGIVLAGVVEAGLPSPAGDALADVITLDDFLIRSPEDTFLLEVKGDSMIEAHIAQGDLVLVERKDLANEGDIVIAQADGDWTMKYYRKKGNRPYLEPANKKYKPIYPEQYLHIGGIVKAVIRKY